MTRRPAPASCRARSADKHSRLSPTVCHRRSTVAVLGSFTYTCLADLSAPIDVYSDWVDACDAVAKQAAESTSKPRRDTYGGTASQSRSQAARGETANVPADDGFIDDDELDAEADYADE